MKPRYRTFVRKAFPSLIIVPAMIQLATAAALPTAGNGSVIVTNADDGANHIEANGGVSPIVTIVSGADLTADGAFSAVEINAAGYTDAAFAGYFTVGTPGAIPTFNATPTAPVTGIINNGNLAGGDDGVEGSNNTVTVLNNGSISGANAGTSEIGSNSFFANSGTWSGSNGSGISAFTASNVTVHNVGTITGNYVSGFTPAAGVSVGQNGLVINGQNQDVNGDPISGTGIISATGTLSVGVILGSNATVYNLAGGSITGGTGISALGIGGITVHNWGTITSTGILDTAISGSLLGGDTININYGSVLNGGIATLGGTDVVNLSATYFGDVTVNGNIDGGAGTDTFNLTADAFIPFDIDNGNLLVDGDIDGGSGADTFNLTTSNLGTIYVTGELEGSGGDDIFNLVANSGSLVVGSIDGGGNADTINLTTSGGVGAIVVLEGIDGDSGSDIVNLNGGLTTALDFSGDSTVEDYIESANSSGLILIRDGLVGVQTLNKNDAGTAFITGFDFGNGIVDGSIDNVFSSSAVVEVDTINVNGGALYINGSVADAAGTGLSNIGVTSAALGGTGAWDANVSLDNSGISAGQTPINLDWNINVSLTDTDSSTPIIDPIGNLAINGSLDLNNGSFIRYDLDTQLNPSFFSTVSGGGVADLITHTTSGGGVVEFDSDTVVRLSPTSLNATVSDGFYEIVRSDTTISGSPDSANVVVQINGNIQDGGQFYGSQVPNLSGTQTQVILNTNLASFSELFVGSNGTGESLYLVVNHDYEGLAGLTKNQAALGAAIDNLVSSSNSQVQDFIGALDLSDAQTAVETIASLSPEGQISQSLALVNSNYRTHRLLQNHLAAVRGSGDTVRVPVGAPAQEVAAAPVSTKRGNVWGSISYDWQDYSDDDSDSDTDYDGEAVAVTAGFDYRVAPQLVLGLLVDGSSGDYDYDAGGDSDVDSLRIALYGTWGGSTGLYSDFSVGYGSHDLDYHRNLGGILGGSASGSTDANSVQALWTVGYTFSHQQIKHGPFVGAEYQKVEVDGYDEDGILDVKVDDYDVDSLRGLIGYRAEATYGRFTPYATLAYAHEFKDDEVETRASLEGSPFTVRTAGLGSAIIGTLGTSYAVNDSLSFDVGYRGEISVDDEGIDSHGLNVGVNWGF